MSGCQRRALACRRGLLCQQDGAIQVATSEVEPGLPAGMSGLGAIDLNESKRESGGRRVSSEVALTAIAKMGSEGL